MHVMLAWDIAATGERWKAIDETLLTALKPYSWVRPLKSVFVVRMPDDAARRQLQDDLVAKAKATKETVRFLITPLMSGGNYNGFLPSDAWTKINERTG